MSIDTYVVWANNNERQAKLVPLLRTGTIGRGRRLLRLFMATGLDFGIEALARRVSTYIWWHVLRYSQPMAARVDEALRACAGCRRRIDCTCELP
jgi:hypothetical protein